MASGDNRPAAEDIDARDLVIGVIATRWNTEIVQRLTDGARRAIEHAGATRRDITVPGAFELPLAARSVIGSGTVDAVVVIGAVIRGETTHYELVADGCARGVMDVQLATGVPIGMGVLTVENEAQARARSQPAGGHNVGEEATQAAIEMAILTRREAGSREGREEPPG
jgi:6,7-dimethyl-8-ribityllumazine synthase